MVCCHFSSSLGELVRRFSLLATWAVALLIASGLVNTWYMTDGMRHLFGTEYGSLVLARVGLLVIMLGFASVNRFWLTPRLPTSQGAKAARLLCISTAAEIALGLIVICVVAVLGAARASRARPHNDYVTHRQVGDARENDDASLLDCNTEATTRT